MTGTTAPLEVIGQKLPAAEAYLLQLGQQYISVEVKVAPALVLVERVEVFFFACQVVVDLLVDSESRRPAGLVACVKVGAGLSWCAAAQIVLLSAARFPPHGNSGRPGEEVGAGRVASSEPLDFTFREEKSVSRAARGERYECAPRAFDCGAGAG